MSELTAPTHTSRGSLAALLLALAAVGLWVAAGTVNDGFYALAGIVGLVAAVAGARARRGPGRRVALAAMFVGGLLALVTVVYSVIWGIGQLV